MKAILYSEDIAAPQHALCMNFAYFMNSTGAAVVRVHQVSAVSEYNPVWEHFGRGAATTDVTGDRNSWRHAKVPLDVSVDDFIVSSGNELYLPANKSDKYCCTLPC